MEMDSLTNGVLLVLEDFRWIQCVSWQKDCREAERRNIADGKMHDKEVSHNKFGCIKIINGFSVKE